MHEIVFLSVNTKYVAIIQVFIKLTVFSMFFIDLLIKNTK